jgi:hypothetical protein
MSEHDPEASLSRRAKFFAWACRVVARLFRFKRFKGSAFAKAPARQSGLSSVTRAKTGGKGIRTPDIQLAKLALYQLSYAPA